MGVLRIDEMKHFGTYRGFDLFVLSNLRGSVFVVALGAEFVSCASLTKLTERIDEYVELKRN